MADERERQIRERLATRGWMPGQMATDLVYLLDALAAAREENGRLREAAERLDRFWRSLDPLEAKWPPELVKAVAGIQAALAREDDNGVPE